ncbi:hypothetical protein AVEN_177665-1 [Araneus ventricosus]|uniref:Uncharacterized protein n=1 Tax=Araneus ventricosus TaxID=182803 RepID=A0A4Y2MK82_ARAVE|nr:hypothetical protein AVEN_18870-1 [Araneus ventricosus]GBN26780.1 hypothetical protein AVEN_177665-1 [Araneus ventricosus]
MATNNKVSVLYIATTNNTNYIHGQISFITGIKLNGSFHRSITGIRVLDQVAVYQLTAADATRQLLLCFLSGHIRSLTFSDNSKCFEICPKCTAEQATPDHILACQGLSKQDLVSHPLLTLDFFRVNRLMDLI